MPPRKRASSGSAQQSKQPKNAKTNNQEKPESSAKAPSSKRWTKTCVSANLDANYSEYLTKKADTAFSFICFCPPHHLKDDDDDEDEDEEEGESDEEDTKYRCDNGETCLCAKPAAEHPEHPWAITNAGVRKLSDIHVHVSIRCPDLFDLYLYNDFAGYGLIEVLQNLVLDFVEAEANWKEQWAVCEAAAHFIIDNAVMPMTTLLVCTIDDGDCANDTYCLIGGLFLTILAKLESESLLGPDSEIENLGSIMASFIRATSDMRDYGISEDRDDETDQITKFHNADAYVLAYAKKHNIKLRGPPKLDKCLKDLEEELEEINLPKTTKKDPWDGMAAFKEYEKRYGKGKKPKVGGNEFDITAMSSAERKSSSFNKKDPLGKAELDAIKQGMILQLA